MFEQESLIGAVDYYTHINLGIYTAYEKYCGSFTLEDIFTSDHVSICARRCASGFMDKADTRQFMKACEYNSRILAKKVCAERYKPKYYKPRDIMERGKKRHIRPPVFECKVVQKVLSDYVIRPLFEQKMISTSYASITGRGTDRLFKDLLECLNRLVKEGKPKLLIITDYSGYFASISHEKLKSEFDRYIVDYRITKLIMKFCETDEGLSLGNEVSQIPASYFPSSIDHWAKDQNQLPFFRYMDDTLAAVDYEKADWYVNEFKYRSEKIGLLLKDDKIKRIPLGQKVIFCKERFYVDKRTGLYYRTANPKRVSTEIKKLRIMNSLGLDKDYIKAQYDTVYGTIEKHPNSYRQCEKLDHAWTLIMKEEKQMDGMLAVIKNAEVRGFEKKKDSKGSDYILVRFDSEENTNGKTTYFLDYNMNHSNNYYKKGAVGTLYVRIVTARYCHIEIEKFEPNT